MAAAVAGARPPLARQAALTLLRRSGARQAAAPGTLGEPRRPHGSNGALRGATAGAAPRGALPAAPVAPAAPAAPPAAAPKPEVDDSGTDTEDEGELIKRAQAARTALDRYVAPGPARERVAPAPALHAGAPAGAGAPAAPAAMPKRRNANAGARPTCAGELPASRGRSARVSRGVKRGLSRGPMLRACGSMRSNGRSEGRAHAGRRTEGCGSGSPMSAFTRARRGRQASRARAAASR
jgi:hypothetical protein